MTDQSAVAREIADPVEVLAQKLYEADYSAPMWGDYLKTFPWPPDGLKAMHYRHKAEVIRARQEGERDAWAAAIKCAEGLPIKHPYIGPPTLVAAVTAAVDASRGRVVAALKALSAQPEKG